MNERILLLAASMMAGTLLLFGGWSLYRAGIRLIGFLIGCALGAALTYTVLALLQSQQPALRPYVPWITAGVAVLVGLLNARLFLKLYYLVVFVAGAVYGVALKIHWLDAWPPAVEWMESVGFLARSPWGEIVAGLLLGVLCVVLHRYLIIVLTALSGSALIALSTRFYWAFPVLLIVGILSQLRLLRLFRIRPQGRGKG